MTEIKRKQAAAELRSALEWSDSMTTLTTLQQLNTAIRSLSIRDSSVWPQVVQRFELASFYRIWYYLITYRFPSPTVKIISNY